MLADWTVHIDQRYSQVRLQWVRRMLQRVIRQHSEQCSCRRLNSCSPLPPSGDPVAMLQPPMPQVPQCHSERRKGARKQMTIYSCTVWATPQLGLRRFERTCTPLRVALVQRPSLQDTNQASHGLDLRRLSTTGHALLHSGGRSARMDMPQLFMFMSERPITHLIESSSLPVRPQSSRMSFFIHVRR